MSEGIIRREQTSSKPELEVIGGLHSGVNLPLDEGTYSIGSTGEADIVLRDPGVAAEHALLRIDAHGVRIEAVGGDLGVGDELVAKGHGCKLRMPIDIAMGTARLRLSAPGDVHAGVFTGLYPVGNFLSRKPLVSAGGVICCALAVSVVTRGAPPPVKAAHTAPVESKLELTKTAYYSDAQALGKIAENSTEAAPRSAIEDAASELTEKLKSLNLQTLKVTAADKRVVAVGTLPKDKAAAWTAAQQWFDETYQGRVLLTANVALGGNKPAPNLQLQAIWFGERPYVITEAGAHFYEGALLDNGWILQRIAEDRIVLEREGESLALTYR